MPKPKLTVENGGKAKTRPAPLKLEGATLRAMDGPNEKGQFRFRLEWYPAGKGGQLQTHPLGWLVPLAARREADRLIDGGITEAPRSGDWQIRTIRDLLDIWEQSMEKRSDLSPATIATRKGAVARLTAGIGKKPARDVGKVATVEAYRDESGHASGTIQLDLRCLRLAARWGASRGLAVTPPPMIHLKIRATNSRRTPPLEEVRQVIAALRQPWQRAAVGLLLGTGARVGEIGALVRGDIDRKAGAIRLVGAVVDVTTGKGEERWIPLTPTALAALQELGEEPAGGWPRDARLFPKPRNFRAGVWQALEAGCKAAGVARFSPHGLRRLAVDEMRRAGQKIEVVATITGHSPVTLLSKYRQVGPEEVIAAMREAPLGGKAPEAEAPPLPEQPLPGTLTEEE